MSSRRQSLGPNLGPLLRAAFRASGLTQQQLADACGINRSYMAAKIFTGKRKPSFAVVELLCQGMGIHVADLYSPSLQPDRELMPMGPKPLVSKKQQNGRS